MAVHKRLFVGKETEIFCLLLSPSLKMRLSNLQRIFNCFLRPFCIKMNDDTAKPIKYTLKIVRCDLQSRYEMLTINSIHQIAFTKLLQRNNI